MSGLGLKVRVLLLFGHLPLRILPMLVMLGLVVVSLRGAPVSLPTYATAQFKRFFECRRAVRCLLPLGTSWCWSVYEFMCSLLLSGC